MELPNQRLDILRRLQLTGPQADPSLDRVARVAAISLGMPVGLVTFLDSQQWHKGRHGWNAPSLPMTDSFCAVISVREGVAQVQDTHLDPRLADMRLTQGEGAFRFYAGCSVVYESLVIGSVCVLDRRPGRMQTHHRTILEDLAALVVDVLHARDRQLALQRSEQRALDFARASGDWFWETDAQHRFSWLSNDFESQAGVPPAVLLGMLASQQPVHRLAGVKQVGMTLGELLERHEPFQTAVSALELNGHQRLLSRSGVPVYTPAGEFAGYRGVSRDVTVQLRHAEQAQERETQRMAAEQANQAKSRFLSRVSHELRTPLNAVLGFMQLMLFDPHEPLSPRTRERVEAVRCAGERLLSLIEDLLNLSRMEAGDAPLPLTTVDVGGVVRQTATLLHPLAHESGVQISHTPSSAYALADERALGQVLLNLGSNAIKYNRPGGSVHVRVEEEAGAVAIVVQDSGVGMTEQQLAHLFEPFNRLGAERSEVQGTGLGLVIARSMVEAMGGTLTFRSAPGIGTTAVVRLPGTRPQPHDVSAPGPGWGRSGQR